MKLFTPSGRKFYVLFEEVADNLKKGAELFHDFCIETNREEQKTVLDKIEQAEDANDKLTHRLHTELGKTFITPFDREDIHYMASSLDDVMDYTWGTSKQMYYFELKPKGNTALSVANNLIQYAELLHSALVGLQNRRELNLLTDILHDLRKITSDNDSYINTAIFTLFNEEKNDLEVIKMNDHYNMLQQLNDKCADVINVLEGIIIKYA